MHIFLAMRLCGCDKCVGKAWETVLTGNDHSFEQIYDKNATVCPRALEFVIAATHATAFATIHGL